MFSSFWSSGSEASPSTTASEDSPENKPYVLFVIVPSYQNSYKGVFEGVSLQNGQKVEVIEAMWSDFVVFCNPKHGGGCECYVSTLHGREGNRTFKPNMLLVRSEVRGVLPEQDFRNSLYALMYSNVPSVNSLHSIYCFLERPVVQAELNRLGAALGHEAFPVVEQSFFSSHREFMYGNTFPAIVKLGHAHSGYGKMKIEDHRQMADFRSIVAVTGQYVTAEPFLDGAYDLRIQYIRGSRVRVFKRESICGNWKTNTGSAHMTEVPADEISALHISWAEHAATMFGGLDICTVDTIHDIKTGGDVIMEVNGTSSGFSPFGIAEDMAALWSLVMGRMNDTLPSV